MSNFSVRTLALVLALILVGSGSAFAGGKHSSDDQCPRYFNITGQVVCKGTSDPIPGITVNATSEFGDTFSTETDANGQYGFQSLLEWPVTDYIVWIPVQAGISESTEICPVPSGYLEIPDAGFYFYDLYFGDPGLVDTDPGETLAVHRQHAPPCDPDNEYPYHEGVCWDYVNFEIPCDDPPGECEFVCDLTAGQHIDVGEVTASISGNTLTVEFSTISDWLITECHVAVGESLADIPTTGSGNPKVGQFPYKETHNPGVSTCTFEIDISGLTLPLVIATHAVVENVDEYGEAFNEETAWCGTEDFPGRSWATYFIFDCE